MVENPHAVPQDTITTHSDYNPWERARLNLLIKTSRLCKAESQCGWLKKIYTGL